ncbi:MAG TPA: PQQ-dependent sugar dehydrogenase [Thermoanaerobaculia bacterium]|nr:PQQ-dependent sugar dehydrogenase [Thermoanaerobaculia bacterium]
MTARLRRAARTSVLLASLLAWHAAPPVLAQLPPVALETLATNLGALTSVTHAGDDRLFLTTLDGRILVWSDGAVRGRPFLDLRSRVRSGGEQGLFSVAFHPKYPIISFLFVNYTDHDGHTVVARYLTNGDVVKPRTARVVLRVAQPFTNHNGGQLQFGPAGSLFVAGLMLGRFLRSAAPGPNGRGYERREQEIGGRACGRTPGESRDTSLPGDERAGTQGRDPWDTSPGRG